MTRTASLTRSLMFDAAHYLSWHPGKCARLHGHTYRLKATVTGLVETNGVVIDLADLKTAAEPTLVELLDHRPLNESIGIRMTERVALHTLDTLIRAGLPGTRVRLLELQIAAFRSNP